MELVNAETMASDFLFQRLHTLKQFSTVEFYQKQFELLQSLVAARYPDLGEDYYVTCCINGLKEGIKKVVQFYEPETVKYALCLATYQESILADEAMASEVHKGSSVVEGIVVDTVASEPTNLSTSNCVTRGDEEIIAPLEGDWQVLSQFQQGSSSAESCVPSESQIFDVLIHSSVRSVADTQPWAFDTRNKSEETLYKNPGTWRILKEKPSSCVTLFTWSHHECWPPPACKSVEPAISIVLFITGSLSKGLTVASAECVKFLGGFVQQDIHSSDHGTIFIWGPGGYFQIKNDSKGDPHYMCALKLKEFENGIHIRISTSEDNMESLVSRKALITCSAQRIDVSSSRCLSRELSLTFGDICGLCFMESPLSAYQFDPGINYSCKEVMVFHVGSSIGDNGVCSVSFLVHKWELQEHYSALEQTVKSIRRASRPVNTMESDCYRFLQTASAYLILTSVLIVRNISSPANSECLFSGGTFGSHSPYCLHYASNFSASPVLDGAANICRIRHIAWKVTEYMLVFSVFLFVRMRVDSYSLSALSIGGTYRYVPSIDMVSIADNQSIRVSIQRLTNGETLMGYLWHCAWCIALHPQEYIYVRAVNILAGSAMLVYDPGGNSATGSAISCLFCQSQAISIQCGVRLSWSLLPHTPVTSPNGPISICATHPCGPALPLLDPSTNQLMKWAEMYEQLSNSVLEAHSKTQCTPTVVMNSATLKYYQKYSASINVGKFCVSNRHSKVYNVQSIDKVVVIVLEGYQRVQYASTCILQALAGSLFSPVQGVTYKLGISYCGVWESVMCSTCCHNRIILMLTVGYTSHADATYVEYERLVTLFFRRQHQHTSSHVGNLDLGITSTVRYSILQISVISSRQDMLYKNCVLQYVLAALATEISKYYSVYQELGSKVLATNTYGNSAVFHQLLSMMLPTRGTILGASIESTSVANTHIYCVLWRMVELRFAFMIQYKFQLWHEGEYEYAFCALYCKLLDNVEKFLKQDITSTESRSCMFLTILLLVQSMIPSLKLLPWDFGFSATVLVFLCHTVRYCLLSNVSSLGLISWARVYFLISNCLQLNSSNMHSREPVCSSIFEASAWDGSIRSLLVLAKNISTCQFICIYAEIVSSGSTMVECLWRIAWIFLATSVQPSGKIHWTLWPLHVASFGMFLFVK